MCVLLPRFCEISGIVRRDLPERWLTLSSPFSRPVYTGQEADGEAAVGVHEVCIEDAFLGRVAPSSFTSFPFFPLPCYSPALSTDLPFPASRYLCRHEDLGAPLPFVLP
jgi:hypothetical protein